MNPVLRYFKGCLGCILALVMAALPVIWTVYLGIYAFDNPDQPAWYGVVDGKPSLFGSPDEQGAGELTDVHQRFVSWFLWGFIQALAPWLLAPFIVSCMVLSPELGSLCGILSCCGLGCSAIAWWIAGIVWRFRSDGSYACGDELAGEGGEVLVADAALVQASSGKFMLIYYCICAALAVFNICVSCMYTCIGIIDISKSSDRA